MEYLAIYSVPTYIELF